MRLYVCVGNLSQLLVLSAQRNDISQLPASMTKMRLDCLDLFGNPLQQITASQILASNLQGAVPSLQEITAKFIKTKG
jgi:hypothetical protein